MTGFRIVGATLVQTAAPQFWGERCPIASGYVEENTAAGTQFVNPVITGFLSRLPRLLAIPCNALRRLANMPIFHKMLTVLAFELFGVVK